MRTKYATLLEKIHETDMAQGERGSLLNWLREDIHQHGRKFSPGELVQRVTGQPLSHEPFIRYITAKFSDLYHL